MLATLPNVLGILEDLEPVCLYFLKIEKTSSIVTSYLFSVYSIPCDCCITEVSFERWYIDLNQSVIRALVL